MKKVLIVTYYFNQKEEVGSLRLRGLAKFLPNFDWEPIILTIKSNSSSNHNFKLLETNFDDVKSKWKKKLSIDPDITLKEQLGTANSKNKKGIIDYLLYLWEEIFAYPDSKKYWYDYAVESGSKLLEKEKFDAIISSSYPVTSHLIAKKLKKEHNIPWVADLRDLWTKNPYWNHLYFRKIFEKRLELNTLKEADVITTTTEHSTQTLMKFYQRKSIYTIQNGFDPDENNEKDQVQDKLKILYSGQLYRGKRDPELLFKALNELNVNNEIRIEDFILEFYGYDEGWLTSEIDKFNLNDIVKVNGLISRDEVLEKQRKSQILLLLAWNDKKEAGIIPGKIFEYFAAKRPILSIGPSEGLVKNMIESTNSGIHLSTYNEIKQEIKKAYNEFTLNGKIEYKGIEQEIKQYSQVEMAKKFADILNNIYKN